MGIGSIGFPEILVIVLLALVFFGPRRMPEMARALGKAMREFRKGLNEVQRELEQAGREDEAARWDSTSPRPAGPIQPPRETPPPRDGPVEAVPAGGEPTGGPPAEGDAGETGQAPTSPYEEPAPGEDETPPPGPSGGSPSA